MRSETLLRVFSLILLLISALFMPLWLTALLALGAMLYFPFFYEAIFVFLLSDLLYGVGQARFYNLLFVSTLASAISLILVEFLKKKVRFYQK